jgi:hypothetical protein
MGISVTTSCGAGSSVTSAGTVALAGKLDPDVRLENVLAMDPIEQHAPLGLGKADPSACSCGRHCLRRLAFTDHFYDATGRGLDDDDLVGRDEVVVAAEFGNELDD